VTGGSRSHLTRITAVPELRKYLNAKFSLKNGQVCGVCAGRLPGALTFSLQFPHELRF
jgi:hypothetical protein